VIAVTPELQLNTMYALDARGRIRSGNDGKPGPFFALIRSASRCAWAVRADLPEELAAELDRLAAEEPPLRQPEAPPLHQSRYRSLVGGEIVAGPAFTFPDELAPRGEVTIVDELRMLEHNFRGWTADEIPWRSPIMAVMEHGYPVSVCFCAASSDTAVEAGVETAEAFRGRGFAPRVTAAWAIAMRAAGKIPLYSTSWSNTASRAVARKLGLSQYASDWSLVDKPRT
jgi:GNAT acetyltransferase